MLTLTSARPWARKTPGNGVDVTTHVDFVAERWPGSLAAFRDALIREAAAQGIHGELRRFEFRCNYELLGNDHGSHVEFNGTADFVPGGS